MKFEHAIDILVRSAERFERLAESGDFREGAKQNAEYDEKAKDCRDAVTALQAIVYPARLTRRTFGENE